MDGGSSAYPILNTNEIYLLKEKGSNISIKTEGFNNFMLWTEVSYYALYKTYYQISLYY